MLSQKSRLPFVMPSPRIPKVPHGRGPGVTPPSLDHHGFITANAEAVTVAGTLADAGIVVRTLAAWR